MNKDYSTGKRSKLVSQDKRRKAITALYLLQVGFTKTEISEMLPSCSISRINEYIESNNLLTVEYND